MMKKKQAQKFLIISHSLTIQYGNNRSSVTFTDEIGTERKYTLNEEGYATQ